MIDIFYRECDKNREKITLVYCHRDILEANAKGKIAALLAVEGGEVTGGDTGVMRMQNRLGVRVFGFVYHRSELADGAPQNRTKGGLTTCQCNS